jgi:hypothetical protein
LFPPVFYGWIIQPHIYSFGDTKETIKAQPKANHPINHLQKKTTTKKIIKDSREKKLAKT